MASFNKVILLGNLTRDPEVRYTPKGSAVCDLGLAVNRTYTLDNGEKREEVTFVDVVLWARLAEIAGEYLKKGRPVFIEGRLQMDSPPSNLSDPLPGFLQSQHSRPTRACHKQHAIGAIENPASGRCHSSSSLCHW